MIEIPLLKIVSEGAHPYAISRSNSGMTRKRSPIKLKTVAAKIRASEFMLMATMERASIAVQIGTKPEKRKSHAQTGIP